MRLMPLLLGSIMAAASPAFAAEQPKWTYDSDMTGQEDWGSITRDYAVCENGTQQSPIVVGSTQLQDLPDLQFKYAPTVARIDLAQHTLEVTMVDPDSTLTIDGNPFRLRRIVFHTPSEHTVGSQFWLLEIQMEHEDAHGQRLIVSSFANKGAANPGLQLLLDHLPENKYDTPKVTLDANAFLPEQLGYYAYTGSLTVPPCTQNIEWRLLKAPITISQDQLAAIAKLLGRNARLPQPLYMRTVSETKD